MKLADASLSEQQLLTAMTEHPKLIERPIMVAGGKARSRAYAENPELHAKQLTHALRLLLQP